MSKVKFCLWGLHEFRARIYNVRIILAALSGEPLRAGKGSHPSVNTGPFFVRGACGAVQHARFAGLSAFCRSSPAQSRSTNRYSRRVGSTLEATPRDDFAESEPEGRSVLTSEAQPSMLTRREAPC